MTNQIMKALFKKIEENNIMVPLQLHFPSKNCVKKFSALS